MCLNRVAGQQISLHPYGGGDPGICRIFSGDNNLGDGHTTCDASFVVPDGYSERGRIQLVPIEEVLGTDLQVFFLKIDVEGYEYKVMKTVSTLLEKVGEP